MIVVNPLDLVGTTYDKDHDCYWVVRTVARQMRGIDLPEKPIGWRRFGKTIDWPTETVACDLIFCSMNALRMVDHVGIAISNTDFLHSSHIHGGVVCEPIFKYSAIIIAVGRLYDS